MNCCHGWRIDSTAQTALGTQKSTMNCCHRWRIDLTAQTALGTQKSSTNCYDGWHMGSIAQAILGTQKSTTTCCHGWRMDSRDQPAPMDSEIINELVTRVTHGFDSPNIPKGLRNHQRTAVTGDPWIRQPKQPVGTHKSSTNCCQGWRIDSIAQTAPRDSEMSNELLSRVTHVFKNTNSPRDSEIINELLSRVTHGFDSSNSP
jgi:hypothetical protein